MSLSLKSKRNKIVLVGRPSDPWDGTDHHFLFSVDVQLVGLEKGMVFITVLLDLNFDDIRENTVFAPGKRLCNGFF